MRTVFVDGSKDEREGKEEIDGEEEG